MSQQKCRWGILSTAGIAHKNWRAIQQSGNGLVTAVASRDQEKARAFIRDCQSQAPFVHEAEAIGSYEALLARHDIDAVYIPLPTGVRGEWIRRAVQAGKHVLAEKPAGVNAREVHDLLQLCRQHRRQYMDGVMFMHSQRLHALRSILKDRVGIGDLRRIACQFSFAGDDEFFGSNIRVDSRFEPFGCVGDLGWYCIRIVLWTMEWQMPLHVVGRQLSSARAAASPGSVPTEFTGELFYENGVTASFYCSFKTANEQWCVISGTDGNIRLPDFVLPYYGSDVNILVHRDFFDVQGCNFHMQRRCQTASIPEYSDGHSSSQEANMFRTFGDHVLNDQPDDHWGEIALKTQQVLDALMMSAQNDASICRLPL